MPLAFKDCVIAVEVSNALSVLAASGLDGGPIVILSVWVSVFVPENKVEVGDGPLKCTRVQLGDTLAL